VEKRPFSPHLTLAPKKGSSLSASAGETFAPDPGKNAARILDRSAPKMTFI